MVEKDSESEKVQWVIQSTLTLMNLALLIADVLYKYTIND